MGTRADFYIGIDKNARWLGSIAWDGYPEGIPDDILGAGDSGGYVQGGEDVFVEAVKAFIAERDDGTTPENGWPWPWKDSNTTDYAYAYHEDRVLINGFGCGWQTPEQMSAHEEAMSQWYDNDEDGPEPEPEFLYGSNFPDMTAVQNVTLGERSGVMVLALK